MKLLEFFGRSHTPKTSSEKSEEKFAKDDLFWSIVDNDELYKKHFFPLARKMKTEGKYTRESIIKKFLPMVNQGCMDFAKKEKIFGNPSKLFSIELREEMCERLYDHFYDDVKKNIYNLGDD